MDTTSFSKPAVEAGKPSRLPAGSTLEVAPGVHVPHPHAEVNLPGIGDPRVGETDAVTEFAKSDTTVGTEFTTTLEQKPLAEEVKPKVVTVAGSQHIAKVTFDKSTPASAQPVDQNLSVEEPTLHKTE